MFTKESEHCNICFKSCSVANLLSASSFYELFSKILGPEVEMTRLQICVWCKATLKKLHRFVSILEASQKILSSACNDTSSYIGRNNTNSPYNFTFHHNNHEDIPPYEMNPFSFDTNGENFLEMNDDLIEDSSTNTIEQVIEDVILKDEYKPKDTIDTETTNTKKTIDYQQMKFNVTYLTTEEQLKEIETKRSKEKYTNMKFHCEKCGIGFLTDDVFGEHMKRHEVKTDYQCTICETYVKSKEVLSQHRLAHRRRFVCQQCGVSYNRWRHCVLHRYKCDSIQSWVVCEDCKKVFSNAISLDIHKRGVHQKEKKYMCDQCEKRFATKQRLTVHLRIHSNTRPFSCPTCPLAFRTASALRSHRTAHTARAARFYCVECDLSYSSHKGYMRHCREASAHVGSDVKYKCPDCPKSYSSDSLMKAHVKSRHLTTHRCTQCEKTFSTNSNLRKHMRCVHSAGGEKQQ